MGDALPLVREPRQRLASRKKAGVGVCLDRDALHRGFLNEIQSASNAASMASKLSNATGLTLPK